MRSHCVRTDMLASSLKLEPGRLHALSQTVKKKRLKKERKQSHALHEQEL